MRPKKQFQKGTDFLLWRKGFNKPTTTKNISLQLTKLLKELKKEGASAYSMRHSATAELAKPEIPEKISLPLNVTPKTHLSSKNTIFLHPQQELMTQLESHPIDRMPVRAPIILEPQWYLNKEVARPVAKPVSFEIKLQKSEIQPKVARRLAANTILKNENQKLNERLQRADLNRNIDIEHRVNIAHSESQKATSVQNKLRDNISKQSKIENEVLNRKLLIADENRKKITENKINHANQSKKVTAAAERRKSLQSSGHSTPPPSGTSFGLENPIVMKKK
ncbi:MAG: hypothetical protein EZS28_006427 [Streblomastix strix]|uniref:Uncharacterized protein n=1 Tax=Streblomastix strix TaxID=222440 RepID=A0A5J4WV44_9EUKA|nr:MAG: hypothetical protein EZS28_006427 [Streblomastix strix]